MNLFRREVAADPAATAGAIPVVDCRSYFTGAPGSLDRLAGDVAVALRLDADKMGYLPIAATILERPYDPAQNICRFKEANAR